MNLVVLPSQYAHIPTGAPLRPNKAFADLLATGVGLRDPLRARDFDDTPEAGSHAARRTPWLRCHATSEPIEIAAAQIGRASCRERV